MILNDKTILAYIAGYQPTVYQILVKLITVIHNIYIFFKINITISILGAFHQMKCGFAT